MPSPSTATRLLFLLSSAVAGWAADVATETVPAAYQGTPYTGTAARIPGVITAVAYDVAPGAADGIAFHYRSAARKGPFRSTADCIGVAGFGAGHVTTAGAPEAADQAYLGWTHVGEWWRYTVVVDEAGTYRIGGHFAAGGKGAKLEVAFGPALTTTIEVPTTAGFQPGVEVYHVWERCDDLGEIALPAGPGVMTVTLSGAAGLNIESLSLTRKPGK